MRELPQELQVERGEEKDEAAQRLQDVDLLEDGVAQHVLRVELLSLGLLRLLVLGRLRHNFNLNMDFFLPLLIPFIVFVIAILKYRMKPKVVEEVKEAPAVHVLVRREVESGVDSKNPEASKHKKRDFMDSMEFEQQDVSVRRSGESVEHVRRASERSEDKEKFNSHIKQIEMSIQRYDLYAIPTPTLGWPS